MVDEEINDVLPEHILGRKYDDERGLDLLFRMTSGSSRSYINAIEISRRSFSVFRNIQVESERTLEESIFHLRNSPLQLV